LGGVGVIPRHLDVTSQADEEEQVGGSVAENLIRNVGVPTAT
jgi:hypothetical protein